MHIRVLLCALVLISSTLSYAVTPDTLVVRLKNGSICRGELVSKADSSIVIKSSTENFEINFNEILFLSSYKLYDSLRTIKNNFVINSVEKKDNSPWEKISAEFMIGKGFQYNRFVGIGIEASYKLFEKVDIGMLSIFHFGDNEIEYKKGHGACFYWGPKVSFTFNFGDFIMEPILSFGEAALEGRNYFISNYYWSDGFKKFDIYRYKSTTTIYGAIGTSFKMKKDGYSVGVHLKYFYTKDNPMFGVYFAFGK